jgi:hypothetical protein
VCDQRIAKLTKESNQVNRTDVIDLNQWLLKKIIIFLRFNKNVVLQLSKQSADADIELKKLAHKLQRLAADEADAKQKVTSV